MILPIVAVLMLAACIAIPVVAIRRTRPPARRELPPLVFSPRAWQTDPDAASSSERRGFERPSDASSFAPASPAAAPLEPASFEPASPVAAAAEPGHAAPTTTETVHFRRPSDQAVQVLPGRL